MTDTAETYDLAMRILASTPTTLSALLEPLPTDVWTWEPAPAEWSPQETLAHMLHVETAVIPARVRQMIETDGAALVSAEPQETPATSGELLAAWQAARERNLAFLRALTSTQLTRGGQHPKYGRISAREHIVEWAYHDLEHLRQLQATLEARIYPDIGGFRQLYNPPYPVS